jgi:hypothetical protein
MARQELISDLQEERKDCLGRLEDEIENNQNLRAKVVLLEALLLDAGVPLPY